VWNKGRELTSHADYAKRHGYDLIVDYESQSSRGTTWLKFDMIERVINAQTHDWIWWMDFDTLITNTTIPLVDVIAESLANTTKPADVDFLVNNDWYDCSPYVSTMILRL
jgi:mannan polymerase II complex MNN10 subunit